MLAVSTPQSGEHNDLDEIAAVFDELIGILKAANIESKWLFLNADPGFDRAAFREQCCEDKIEANIKSNPRNNKTTQTDEPFFDELLYKRRTKIEHANAWMDSFKALLVRFETRDFTWMDLQWLSFITLFCRKLKV